MKAGISAEIVTQALDHRDLMSCGYLSHPVANSRRFQRENPHRRRPTAACRFSDEKPVG